MTSADCRRTGFARDSPPVRRQYGSSTESQTLSGSLSTASTLDTANTSVTSLQQTTSTLHQSENTTTIVSEVNLTTTICTSDTDVGAASSTAPATTPQDGHTTYPNNTKSTDKPKECPTVTFTTTETTTITETENSCQSTLVTDASAGSSAYTPPSVATSPAWTFSNSTATVTRHTSSTSTSTQTITATVVPMQSNPTASTSEAGNATSSWSGPGVPQGPSPDGYNDTTAASTAGSMLPPPATSGTNDQPHTASSQSPGVPASMMPSISYGHPPNISESELPAVSTSMSPSISYGHPPNISTSEGHTSTEVSTSAIEQPPMVSSQSPSVSTSMRPSISYGHPPNISTSEDHTSAEVSTSAIKRTTTNPTSTESNAAVTIPHYHSTVAISPNTTGGHSSSTHHVPTTTAGSNPLDVSMPPYYMTCSPCDMKGHGSSTEQSQSITTPSTSPTSFATFTSQRSPSNDLDDSAICTTTFQHPTENPCTATVFVDTTTLPVDCSGCEGEQPSTFAHYAFVGPSTVSINAFLPSPHHHHQQM